MTSNRTRGEYGEELACRKLGSEGFTVIARNFSCRTGEVDIIAKKDDVLVFAEVKTRSGVDMGLPCQAVVSEKQRKIRKTAEFFLMCFPEYSELQSRFDIIEVLIFGQGTYIRRIENAF